MLKKHGIKYTLEYYRIHELIVFALVMMGIATYFIFTIESYMSAYINDKQQILIRLIIIGAFCRVYFKHVYTTIRSQTYRKLTGRSYGYDHSKYKRSFNELVDYFKDADPYKINTEKLEAVSWKNAEGVILGKTKDGKLFNIPSSKDGRSYMAFGLPSSGKTASIIIPTCLRFGAKHPLDKNNKETDGSVFCIDLKGDIYKATSAYRNIKRFNLMDDWENSCHYNPFSGIEKLDIDARCNFIENIGFNIVSKATGGDGKYFSDTAQDFFNGIALYMLGKDINTSFPDVIKAILYGNPVDWIKRVVADGCEESKRRLQSKYGENEKNLSGAYALLSQSCRKFASEKLFFLLGNEPEYDYISVQSMEDGNDVYLQLKQSEICNYSALLSMIVQGFLNDFLIREENQKAGRLSDGSLRPQLMVLDEFAQLTNLEYDCVKTAFMTLRSRNVSILCALQSRSSISEMFHSEDACKSLIDCVTTFAFLSIQEVETRKWASELIGTRKVLKTGNNLNNEANGTQGTGSSAQEAEEPIFHPADFGNLIDKNTGKDEIIIYSQGKYLKANKQYYFKD
ncbi:Type IV secretory system Conjugative DNA transfer [Pseudobutyrivibrio sp. 49]|uniref:type IV secretory system conjugative DNA transfer family protein n=1 Tax=Pseudobutyrivibrio sp. 49 TaxID=1855344 RepID=UPI00088B6231|nr:type IV secretory system conjugative DNA transfer family protein [Pseudobutyrivibrio sp. 49]SDI51715.1 Type IV secretory system Conjugative DNA transfer [Pseudobutyrivibrio sp. 49]